MTVVHLKDVVADLVEDLDLNEAEAHSLVWSLVEAPRAERDSLADQVSLEDLLSELESE